MNNEITYEENLKKLREEIKNDILNDKKFMEKIQKIIFEKIKKGLEEKDS